MENWKAIEDFPSYEVSDLGRVRRATKGRGTRVGRVLQPMPHRDGYLQVSLTKDTKRYTEKVHRLVAKAFIPNPSNLPEVNHKDEGTRTDNRAIKLEWRSKKGHILDTVFRGQRKGDGVSLHKNGTWVARYTPVGSKKYKHLGCFLTREEALAARRAAMAALPYIL